MNLKWSDFVDNFLKLNKGLISNGWLYFKGLISNGLICYY